MQKGRFLGGSTAIGRRARRSTGHVSEIISCKLAAAHSARAEHGLNSLQTVLQEDIDAYSPAISQKDRPGDAQ